MEKEAVRAVIPESYKIRAVSATTGLSKKNMCEMFYFVSYMTTVCLGLCDFLLLEAL